MIEGTQPHRVVPKRTWGRTFPCGRHDGGFMFGNGDECRAADVLIEDWVGPPVYTDSQRGSPRGKMVVESTHTETRVSGVTEEGRPYAVHTIRHPGGLSR